MPELVGSIAALVAGRPGTHGRAEVGTGRRRLILQAIWEPEQFSDRSCVVFIVADQRQEERDPILVLTPRERETARLAATGLRTSEIAVQLACTQRTVRAHLQATYGKLGLRSRAELAARLAGMG
ncbi:MAG TPA: helix-turn-helix transcriptional regulator [Gemmatimonadales bacterium]|nr:helix-turn-helix transcriptional regulator [Gemmatimonadales bacterium]